MINDPVPCICARSSEEKEDSLPSSLTSPLLSTFAGRPIRVQVISVDTKGLGRNRGDQNHAPQHGAETFPTFPLDTKYLFECGLLPESIFQNCNRPNRRIREYFQAWFP